MLEDENPYWSEEADEHLKWHAPAGTFTQKAPEIVKVLMKGAGNGLSNAKEIEKAKAKLEELEHEA